MTTKSTITDLPKDILKAIPIGQHGSKLHWIMYEASEGEFHDTKSEKYGQVAKMMLAMQLNDVGDIRLKGIINDVENGVYDESLNTDLLKADWILNGHDPDEYDQLFKTSNNG